MRELFRKFASKSSNALGTPWAFLIAVASIVLWAISGPVFHFSDTWQLIANTGTTLVTFLMVFLIQNTQNRDGRAIQLKLDELLRGVKGARTRLVDLEDLSDDELSQLQKQFEALHARLDKSKVRRHERHEQLTADALKASKVRAESVAAGTVEADTMRSEDIETVRDAADTDQDTDEDLEDRRR